MSNLQAGLHSIGTTTIEKLKVLQMYLNDLLKSRREEILQIAAKHGAHNVSIFG
ncbi:MAG: hypothetical protein WB392_11695 [Methanotrichaceae archaeon]